MQALKLSALPLWASVRPLIPAALPDLLCSLQQKRWANYTVDVIIIKEHPKYGAPGKIVTVQPGEARHSLYPGKFAVYATAENKEKYLKENLESDEVSQVDLQSITRILNKEVIVIRRYADLATGPEAMRGCVDKYHIADAVLHRQKIYLPPELVLMDGNITRHGLYKIPLNLRLKTGSQVELNVDVRRRLSRSEKEASRLALEAALANQAKEENQNSAFFGATATTAA